MVKIGQKISMYDVRYEDKLYAVKFQDVKEFEKIPIGANVEFTIFEDYDELDTFKEVK